MQVDVCKHPHNPHIQDTHWVAFLSNGEQIYEDRRPHADSPWLRLKRYIDANHLKINKLNLHAYGVTISTPIHAAGYYAARFHSRLALPNFNAELTMPGIGHIEDNLLKIMWIHPDKLVIPQERFLSKEDAGIIMN